MCIQDHTKYPSVCFIRMNLYFSDITKHVLIIHSETEFCATWNFSLNKLQKSMV